jgi:hypothetical protein
MSSPTEPTPKPAPLTLAVHPPERRRAAGPVVLPAACCCTCCCCLHTVGGLIGAGLGTSSPIASRPRRAADPDAPFPYRLDEFESEGPILPAGGLYWLVVALLVSMVTSYTTLQELLSSPGGNPIQGMLLGVFISVMVLPGIQLGASVLSVLVVLIFYPDKSLALYRVGKITWFSFLGSMLGMLLMGGCLGLMYVGAR